MLRFVLKVLLFSAVQALIASYFFTKYPADRGTYMAATIDKHMLLERQTSPRMIFVGGSNVGFGIDSEMAQNYTTFSQVNMGLHAAAGLEFMLNEIEGELRNGDVVVLAPEFENFAKMGSPIFFYERFVEQRFANVFNIPAKDWPAALDRGLPFGLQLLGNVLHKPSETMATKGRPYCRSGFNTYGDECAHWNAPGNLQLISNELETLFAADESHGLEMIEKVNAFASRCGRRGVAVYFSYPPIPISRYRRAQSAFQTTAALIERDLKVPRLFKFDDTCFPDDLFWDSVHHLNRAGVSRRTRLVLDGLCRYLWKRKPPGSFFGVEPLSGMGPHDDPPADLNKALPQLQIADCAWGLYPKTVLSTEGMSGKCHLHFTAVALEPGRVMSVKIAGTEYHKVEFVSVGQLYEADLQVDIPPGANIDFEYSGAQPSPPPLRPMSVLFKSIRFSR